MIKIHGGSLDAARTGDNEVVRLPLDSEVLGRCEINAPDRGVQMIEDRGKTFQYPSKRAAKCPVSLNRLTDFQVS